MQNKYPILFAILLLFTTITVQAQRFENMRSTFNGESVVITYDLVHPDVAERFKVTVYGSHDDYSKPLTKVVGDVGENVAPGKGLRIVWDAKGTLQPDFDKEITFKIKGAKLPGVPAIAIEPFEHSAYRRGKGMNIKWTGGSSTDKVRIELLKKDTVVNQLAENLNNDHAFAWKIPKNIEKGNDYGIRITKLNTPAATSNSKPFAIKARIPLLVKVLPVVAVGAAVAFWPRGDDEENLPDPIPWPN